MWSLLIHGLVTAFAIVSCSNAIPTISTKDSKFFTSDGDQFFIKGIAYQLSENDPLLDVQQCQRDARLMKNLGANAIRVYHVEKGDHDGCMKAFADAGIYLFVDLATFNTRIRQEAPTWNRTQESAFQHVMDDFHSYENTAGFFIGNEVLQDGEHSEAAVYAKAATRDLKAYGKRKGYRNIPVGYAHADISSLRPNLQNFLACGDDRRDSIDFFGLNAYEWCGSSTFSKSGYRRLNAQVKDFPVPIFFSETGCNTVKPRLFQDQKAIFGSEMDQRWSGAIIYEWIEEVNDYGLVTYGDQTNALASINPTVEIKRSGIPTPVTPDYSRLKSVWAAVTPSSVKFGAYRPDITPPPCPGFTKGTWEIDSSVKLPPVGATFNQAAQRSINGGGGGSPTGASASTSSSGAAATQGVNMEVGLVGMTVALVAVCLGFAMFL